MPCSYWWILDKEEVHTIRFFCHFVKLANKDVSVPHYGFTKPQLMTKEGFDDVRFFFVVVYSSIKTSSRQ